MDRSLTRINPIGIMIWPLILLLNCPIVSAEEFTELLKPAVDVAPLPDPLDLSKGDETVRQVYLRDFQAAQTPAAKIKLAEKLLEQAQQTRDDQPARFALFQHSLRMAESAGDVGIGCDVIEAWGTRFAISPAQRRLEFLKKMQGQPKLLGPVTDLGWEALDGVEEALRRDELEIASELVAIAEKVLKRTRNVPLQSRTARIRLELAEIQKQYAQFQDDVPALDKLPNDKIRHERIGNYLAFVRKEWDRALPHLEQGIDPVLVQLAKQELDPDRSQMELGDGWWDWGKNRKGLEKRGADLRAEQAYERALGTLSGIHLTRVEQRLAELEKNREKELPPESVVYLSSLTGRPRDVFGQMYAIGKRPPEGVRLTLDKKPSRQGIFLHPLPKGTALVSYDLRKTTCRRFRAKVGIDDAAPEKAGSPLTFELWGDDKLLWKSAPCPGPGKTQSCEVRIAGVEQLELRVVCPASNAGAWAIWGDARLVR